MEHSLTLLSAQIHFLDTELALIHIPLPLYNAFVSPLLQLLIPFTSSPDAAPHDTRQPESSVLRQRRPWIADDPFVNISITPVECSIACPRALINELFVPIIDALDETVRKTVVISTEDYIVVQVDGEGEALEAGQRVVELTAPLALNGIPLFFVTTYYSDYILVPLKSRATVISALEQRGFVFEKATEAFVNVSSPHLSSSMHHHHSRSASAAAGPSTDTIYDKAFTPLDETAPPSTPPPSSIAELEARTFALLKRRNVTLSADPSLHLVSCAARRETALRSAPVSSRPRTSTMRLRLQLGLVKCLIRTPRPRFFSVTLTDTETASLLLERELLAEFEDGRGGSDDADAPLLGSKDTLVPITFDLHDLPMESTGIVCGVAGRLVGGMRSRPGSMESDPKKAPVEMSYLSTAMAGTVMVAAEDLDDALAALGREGPAFDGGGVAVGETKPIPIRDPGRT